MTRTSRLTVILLFVAIFILAALVLLKFHCPAQGIPFSKERAYLHRLKNRTALPAAADFDSALTLSAILTPGDDELRWSTARAGRIEGYVVSVGKGPIELANCYLPCSRDIHINLALRPDAPVREQAVLEITPRFEDKARLEGRDWSETALKRELLGHWCYFEGWLFYDFNHVVESENTAPHGANNWRATAWELHPITAFGVLR